MIIFIDIRYRHRFPTPTNTHGKIALKNTLVFHLIAAKKRQRRNFIMYGIFANGSMIVIP